MDYFNGGIQKFTVSNLTSGCSKKIELPIPNKCFNLSHELDKIFGGGNSEVTKDPNCVSVKFSKINRDQDNFSGTIFAMTFQNSTLPDSECDIEMTIINKDLNTFKIFHFAIPKGKSTQTFIGDPLNLGFISSGDIAVEIVAFCNENNKCPTIVKNYDDDDFVTPRQ
ncbi:MAG: hypothetical protein IPJ13_19540 [Saprospiraceae bacterium]|nr:hypothetical protein [Saprospiraceae bacterium]